MTHKFYSKVVVDRIDSDKLKVNHNYYYNDSLVASREFFVQKDDWKAIIDFLEKEGKDGTICFQNENNTIH